MESGRRIWNELVFDRILLSLYLFEISIQLKEEEVVAAEDGVVITHPITATVMAVDQSEEATIRREVVVPMGVSLLNNCSTLESFPF